MNRDLMLVPDAELRAEPAPGASVPDPATVLAELAGRAKAIPRTGAWDLRGAITVPDYSAERVAR